METVTNLIINNEGITGKYCENIAQRWLIGILESNGEQNYVRWEELYQAHPCAENTFARCNRGLYTLSEEFFAISGGIFKNSSYYDTL